MKTFSDSILLGLFSNILFCFFALWFIEFSASKVLKLHNNIYVNKILLKNNVKLEKENSELHEDIKSKIERDNKKRDNTLGSPYLYESYVVFKNKSFQSETLNIENGTRKTLGNKSSSTKEGPIIWVLELLQYMGVQTLIIDFAISFTG